MPGFSIGRGCKETIKLLHKGVDIMESVEKLNIETGTWDDIRSVNESYSSDSDIDLFCEYLGKMRQMSWAVI
jgi:hypothetical protein